MINTEFESPFTISASVNSNKEYKVYINRDADQDLFQHCMTGEICHLLTSRQLGKTSLVHRVAKRLRETDEVRTVYTELNMFGTINITPETWCRSMAFEVAKKLGIHKDFSIWWSENEKSFTPIYQLWYFWENYLLSRLPNKKIVIFIDEIDSAPKINFSDDIFGSIRSTYISRDQNSDLNRLSFVLIGTTSPHRIIRDLSRTPFNIGVAISLDDFSKESVKPLIQALGKDDDETENLLRWIFAWTNGHPYLTQSICNEIWHTSVKRWSKYDIDQIVINKFLPKRRGMDSHIDWVFDWMSTPIDNLSPLEILEVYEDILLHPGKVRDEQKSGVKLHLKLTGIVHNINGFLSVRNEIYRHRFDKKWISLTRIRLATPAPTTNFSPHKVSSNLSLSQKRDELASLPAATINEINAVIDSNLEFILLTTIDKLVERNENNEIVLREDRVKSSLSFEHQEILIKMVGGELRGKRKVVGEDQIQDIWVATTGNPDLNDPELVRELARAIWIDRDLSSIFLDSFRDNISELEDMEKYALYALDCKLNGFPILNNDLDDPKERLEG